MSHIMQAVKLFGNRTYLKKKSKIIRIDFRIAFDEIDVENLSRFFLKRAK